MIIVRDEFYEIVERVKNNMLAETTPVISQLFGFDGNKKELEAIFKDTKGLEKYPAILLVMPFSFKPDEYNELNSIRVNDFKLIIVTSADRSTRNEQRYSDKIKPVLYPIYEALLKVLKTYNKVQGYKIDKVTEFPFWGTVQPLDNEIWESLEVDFEYLNLQQNCV